MRERRRGMHWQIFGEPPGFGPKENEHTSARNVRGSRRIHPRGSSVWTREPARCTTRTSSPSGRSSGVDRRDAPQLAIGREGVRCLRDLACFVSAGDVPEQNTYPAELDELLDTFFPPLRARFISRVDPQADA